MKRLAGIALLAVLIVIIIKTGPGYGGSYYRCCHPRTHVTHLFRGHR